MTIGQLAPASPPTPTCGTSPHDWVQASVTSGNSYVVPANGTITSWSHNATGAGGQTLKMKIFRPLGGTTYTVVGHDGAHPLTGGVVNTFPTSIPVKPGDVLGLNRASPVSTACVFHVTGEEGLFDSAGDLADGESATFDTDFDRLNLTAVLEPTSTFTLGKLKRNRNNGTATLTVNLPNPGQVVLAGKGVKRASSAGAKVAKPVTAPGEVKLRIRAKGRKKNTLNETGKVKVKPKITFTPTGGDPSTRSAKVMLKKR